jgi:sialic acid synthase SpsE
MEPREFGEMVRRLRLTALALGDGAKRPAPDEAAVAQAVRRSWHASRDLPGGIKIESADVVLKRPASGLPPVFEVVGRRLRKQVKADSPITADCLEL